MDQSKNLWEGSITNSSTQFEKTGTSKPVSYGTVSPDYNGNWQPSYAKNGDATCPTFEGGGAYPGGWSNYTTNPRNRYTCGFSRPSYLMGYQFTFDYTQTTITTPPSLSSTNAIDTILQNGPYYSVKNPYYKWNGGTLRSATDADLNVFMAYYIADKLSSSGATGWFDSDVGVEADKDTLPYKATGKDIKWSTMKSEIARSFNENTGGASYAYNQQTSGNIITKNVYNETVMYSIIGMGHDSDQTASGKLHLDYTDLRAFQLLAEEQKK